MPVIDIHSHLFSCAKPLPKAVLDDPQWEISSPEFKAKAEKQELPRIEDYLERMEEWGVDIVCVNNVAMSTDGARAMNEFNAEIIAEYPDRMIGFAAVPVAADQDGPGELEYAVKELGFYGAKIYPRMQNVALDDPAMRPLYECAADLDVPLLTHTTGFPQSYTGAARDSWADPTFDNPGRMFDSGMWGEIPDLKIIFAHQAGGFVYYKDSLVARKPEIEPWFKGMYVDVCPGTRFDKKAVVAAVEALGEDHVLFGIDYPWIDLETCGRSVTHIREMELSADLEEKILGGNAKKLLKLDV
jgi:predicted TIM-barrel fold metal-dependent hydrolase